MKIFKILFFTFLALQSCKKNNSNKKQNSQSELTEEKIIKEICTYKLNQENAGNTTDTWGSLIIEYSNNNIINFKLRIDNQDCVAKIEGKTIIENNIAMFKDTYGGILKLKFIKNKDEITKIEITQKGIDYDAYGSDNCPFYGIFKKK